MFLAIRDLKFARGRFSLITAVVALLTLLVGFLTGLTGGLASQNISALLNTGAKQVVFGIPASGKAGYGNSSLAADQAQVWEDSYRTVPLGIANARLETAETSKSLVLFAAPAGEVHSGAKNTIVLGKSAAAELQVAAGDSVELAGSKIQVAEIIADEYYAHREVAYINIETWHDYLAATRQPSSYASVLLVYEVKATQLAAGTVVDTVADTALVPEVLNAKANTISNSLLGSLLLLESFKSEIGSLAMMIGMLIVIATLVIGVFFLVWSLQRQRDIAVLKALGAKTSWLVKDALSQAIIVLLLGVSVGTVLTLTLGLVVGQALPFVTGVIPLAIPALTLIVAGVLGALVAVQQITRVDANAALQAVAA